MGWEDFKGLKKFSGGGGVKSDYSVCPCPLRWFYACFTSVYVGRDGLSGTPVNISILRFTLVCRDVELDNKTFTKSLKNCGWRSF